MRPGSSSVPIIVCVLPSVWPYAKHVALKPSKSCSTSGAPRRTLTCPTRARRRGEGKDVRVVTAREERHRLCAPTTGASPTSSVALSGRQRSHLDVALAEAAVAEEPPARRALLLLLPASPRSHWLCCRALPGWSRAGEACRWPKLLGLLAARAGRADRPLATDSTAGSVQRRPAPRVAPAPGGGRRDSARPVARPSGRRPSG